MPVFGSPGVGITMKGAPTNTITLPAGAVAYPNSFPNANVAGRNTGYAGWFYAKLGRYTALQIKDPITGIWRGIGDNGNGEVYFYSDGANVRLANQSGCAVGAVVTTAGTGYTTAPTVVASAGASVWQAILGPLVSTTVSIPYGGTNYVYPPLVAIDAPPLGAVGIQATGYATLTNSVVTSITITDQGAGYNGGVPNITLVNDPRDTTGAGAYALATLVGANTIAAVICTDHGNPITSGTVPTLTFGSGSAAATVLMNWGITTYAVTTAGAGYGNSITAELTAFGPAGVASPAYTNPTSQQSLVRVRNANIWVPTNSTGGFTLATNSNAIIDGGVYEGIPTPSYAAQATPSTVGVLALTMGGFNDVSFIQPF